MLYGELGVAGRVLSSLFFLCLSLAGVSSLVALIELPVHTLDEMRGRFSLSCMDKALQVLLRERGGGGWESALGKRNSEAFFLPSHPSPLALRALMPLVFAREILK